MSLLEGAGEERARSNPHATPRLLLLLTCALLMPSSHAKGGRNTVRGNAKRGNGADGVFISLVVEKKHLDECVAGGFDGFYTYFAVDKFSWGSTWRNFKPQQSFADRHGLQFYPSVGQCAVRHQTNTAPVLSMRSKALVQCPPPPTTKVV